MNKLKILYEDNHIIVVVKPNNILSQADNTKDIDMITLIKNYIKAKYNKPGDVYIGLVHRLDRPVSGIMVFAKTSKAASRLSKQIRDNKLKKTYLAVVNGTFDNKKGILENFIEKCKDNSSKIVNQGGKYAKLSYEVIEENKKDNLTLLKVNLETGRHHQIRVQFANIGHPLYGDQRYGKQDKNQIALHAYRLEFTHPTTKELLVFESYPPKKSGWIFFKNVK